MCKVRHPKRIAVVSDSKSIVCISQWQGVSIHLVGGSSSASFSRNLIQPGNLKFRCKLCDTVTEPSEWKHEGRTDTWYCYFGDMMAVRITLQGFDPYEPISDQILTLNCSAQGQCPYVRCLGLWPGTNAWQHRLESEKKYRIKAAEKAFLLREKSEI